MDLLDMAETQNNITKIQYHSYYPFLNNYSYNDEIRITVNSTNFIQLSNSYIYLRIKLGKLAREDTKITFIRNGLLNLFSDVKLEMNGVLLEWQKQPALVNTVLSYLTNKSYDDPGSDEYQWDDLDVAAKSSIDFTIPLKRLLHFANDYKKLLIYSRFDLILIRARSDHNVMYNANAIVEATGSVAPDNVKIDIEKIKFVIPHIEVTDVLKLKLLKILENGREIKMPFRTIEVHENSGIPTSRTLSWSVKSSIRRPLYAIACFQTDKNFQLNKNNAYFDHLDVHSIRLWINQNVYPYESQDLNFSASQYATAYRAMKDFRKSICLRSGAFIDRPTFKSQAPLFCFDLSHYDNHLKDAICDIKLEIEFLNDPPAKTTAYLLLMYENLFSYNPFTEIVLKEL